MSSGTINLQSKHDLICHAAKVKSAASLSRFSYVRKIPSGILLFADVTVIWVSPYFGYPRTQIPSVLGIPSRDTQNTESSKYRRLGQVKSSSILLKNHLYSYEALPQQMKAF